jgi:hypothetical protein
MNPCDTPQDEPVEHMRFAAYLNELAQVADADETALVTKVLSDSDRTMAQSAAADASYRQGHSTGSGYLNR